MIWTILRISIYIIIATAIWLGVQFYIATNLKDQIHTTPEKVLFVNKDVDQHSYHDKLYDSRFTNLQKLLLKKFDPIDQPSLGTTLFPFVTISDALINIQNTGIKVIKISSGVYNEYLELPENTTLIGNDDTTIHTDPSSSKNTIKTSDGTHLKNLNISGGKHTIIIPHNTSAIFDHVTISGAKDFGVKMESKERPETPEGEDELVIYEYYGKTQEEIEQMPLVQFDNCTITKNDNQGMYLRDGRVEILNSKVIENGEEGIDLHPHMHVIITNTDASRNGESGLETEVYDNIITIENSIFDSNIKNGIALITSHGIGDITVKNSTITNNQKYALRCAIHKTKPKSPRPFFQAVITEENNYYKNNVMKYASDCFQF